MLKIKRLIFMFTEQDTMPGVKLFLFKRFNNFILLPSEKFIKITHHETTPFFRHAFGIFRI